MRRRTSNFTGSAVVVAIVAIAAALALPALGANDHKVVAKKTYRFVLSNNFLGNDWRPQMERLATLTAKQSPFAGRITLDVINAESTTQAQVQSLNNIVASKPDAILIDAGSPTALNPAVRRACAAGIVVVSFDQTVTEPCAWRVSQNHGDGQLAIGKWMGLVLKGSGSVFVDRGLPGAPISSIIENGFKNGLKAQAPKVTIGGSYDGKYAIGPTQQAIASLLGGKPDVSGVATQGYCTAAFNAFKQAGKPLVPTTCYGYNGELVACAKNKVPCAILSGSPTVVQIAMKLALDALDRKPTPPKTKNVTIPWTVYLTGPKVNLGKIPAGGSVQYVSLGKNAFPSLPPGLALPYTLPQYKISAGQAVAKR
ncbi:MAG: substrate-binding domain-containing protein [Actinobacteria bacterium]|nr:substrate-binding domain-containing protein [Actinomycetota bacterium]